VVAGSTEAQNVGEVFRKVAPSVVVIRAKGREVSGASGQVRFNETGSGVLISPDGKVMTAAHVVHAMDEISVEFLGGETVKARVAASEPAADLSLLQLERVPPAAQVAKMADSDAVRVGDQIIVVGAPYGLSHALSVGWISARWPPNTVYKTMPLAEFFQTDAVINTGTWQPIFSMAGEVTGPVSQPKRGGARGWPSSSPSTRPSSCPRRSRSGLAQGQILPQDPPIAQRPPKLTGYLVKAAAKNSPGEAMGPGRHQDHHRRRRTRGGRRRYRPGRRGVNVGTAADLVKIREGGTPCLRAPPSRSKCSGIAVLS
jgi:S1-C subfamily serine protease